MKVSEPSEDDETLERTLRKFMGIASDAGLTEANVTKLLASGLSTRDLLEFVCATLEHRVH